MSEFDRYQAIFAAAPVGLVVVDPSGNITETNTAFGELAAQTAAALQGTPLHTLVGTTEAHRLLHDPAPSTLEVQLQSASGRTVETEWRMATCPTTHCRFFSVQDITWRKRQQLALRHNEERFGTIVRAVTDLIWTNNAKGEMEGEQPAWGEFTGQTYDEYQGFGWSKALHPDDLQPTIDAWNRSVAQRAVYKVEHRVRRHDGVYRLFLVRAVPVLESDGSIREWVGVHADITERRATEEALRNSEGRLRLAQAAAGLGIWDLDFASGHLSWSQELHALLGASEEETPSIALAERFIHPEDRQRVRMAVLSSLVKGKPLDTTFRVVRTGGEVRWLLCRASVFADAVGQPARALGVSLDITFQKMAEHRTAFLLALEDVIRNLSDPREIVSSAAMMLAVHLDAGRCSYIETDPQLTSYQVVGAYNRDPAIDITVPFRLTDLAPQFQDAIRQGDLVSVVDSETDSNLVGDAVHVMRRLGIRASLCAPLHKRGKPLAMLSVHSSTPRHWTKDECELVLAVASRCWESLERAKSESQLAQSEQKLQQVFAQAPVAIVVFRGRDLVIEMANPTFESLVQKRLRIGAPLRDLLPELGSHVFEAFDSVLETGEAFVATDFYVPYDQKGDGTIRDHWFNVVYHPLRDRDGNVWGVVAVSNEVTAQVVARKELERANRELEEFAYVASHDLQEPLRMVGIYTELLTKRYLGTDTKAVDYANFIRKGVVRMEQLIQDLLSFSRTIHAEDVEATADLNQSLRLALETLANRIEETGAVVEHRGTLPQTRGDAAQLALVFQNLLSNSLKYAREGVPPRIEIAAEASGNGWLLTFRDNGIGFEQVYAERIFGLFKRLHKDAYAGTGLGLAICQRVVSRYGGTIRAEGRPGDGATFYVWLPSR
ncbi:hypothetical protein F183_A01740 [Bryobacterales bacterium F-183]|nr:hypothetical protein F183_A01740 [Bryobacterales bacterium F-183]